MRTELKGVDECPVPANLQAYLAPDETVVRTLTGTVVGDTYRLEGQIGLTDRRLLVVSEEGECLDVGYEYVYSVRSSLRTTLTDDGFRDMLLWVLGGMGALLAFVSVVVLEPGVLAPGLLFVSVGGLVATGYVQRTRVGVEWSTLDRFSRRVNERLATAETLQRHGRDPADVGNHHLLMAGCGLVALLAFVGVVALTADALVVGLLLVTLAGGGLTEYATRHQRTLEQRGLRRRHDREVRFYLVTGTTVYLYVDAAEYGDSEFGELAGMVMHDLPGAGYTDV